MISIAGHVGCCTRCEKGFVLFSEVDSSSVSVFFVGEGKSSVLNNRGCSSISAREFSTVIIVEFANVRVLLNSGKC